MIAIAFTALGTCAFTIALFGRDLLWRAMLLLGSFGCLGAARVLS